jgi:hypothetical protein
MGNFVDIFFNDYVKLKKKVYISSERAKLTPCFSGCTEIGAESNIVTAK